ncbi:hypothetical protein [Rheinheimera sp.]|uniref:hypothetical protein n=1 Tax=Rheinheimera sp. TaxID=1869214 RepID=UPI002FDE6057
MKQAMIVLGFSLFTLAGCGSTASNSTSAAQANKPVEVKKITKDTDDSALVCRSEKKTGRHMATRVCRTVAQIKEDNRNAEAMMRNSSATPVTNN